MKEEKEIIESGENLKKFKDGSAEVKCQDCGVFEQVAAKSKQADLLQNWPEKANVWQCRDCFLNGKGNGERTRIDEIRLGQAINLANEMVLKNWKGGKENLKEELDVWVDFYLDYIKEKQKGEK